MQNKTWKKSTEKIVQSNQNSEREHVKHAPVYIGATYLFEVKLSHNKRGKNCHLYTTLEARHMSTVKHSVRSHKQN